MNLRQAAQQALEALIPLANAGCPNERECLTDQDHERAAEAVEVLEQALAEPEQEPVAWLWPHQLEELQHIHQLGIRAWSGKRYKPDGLVAVYTAPTPRKPLTVFEIDAIAEHLDKTTIGWATHEFAAAIEKAHGIGEQHE